MARARCLMILGLLLLTAASPARNHYYWFPAASDGTPRAWAVLLPRAEGLGKLAPGNQYWDLAHWLNARGIDALVVDYANAASKVPDAKGKTGQKIEALIPNTGGLLFFDTMVIPADAPHPGNAHKFINYILRPEVHAGLTNKVFYANPNKASLKFVKPDVANNPSVFPSDAAKAAMTPEQWAAFQKYAQGQVAQANSNYGAGMADGTFGQGSLALQRDGTLNAYKGWL